MNTLRPNLFGGDRRYRTDLDIFLARENRSPLLPPKPLENTLANPFLSYAFALRTLVITYSLDLRSNSGMQTLLNELPHLA